MEMYEIKKNIIKQCVQNGQQKPQKISNNRNDIDQNVQECIKKITTKMTNAKIQTLHPPFFQQTLTPFRRQCYISILKKQISEKLSSQNSYKDGLRLLSQFIQNFDEQYIDNYLLQIKQPYIRKIFNQGYQIDKVNFRKLNSQYELRKQIEDVLTQLSDWLTQIQLLEDILSRIQLYFGIEYRSIMEKLKSKGGNERKGGWGDYFASLFRKTTSYGLRKCSKIVQNTYYASLLSPAFAILTWAIIGGSSTVPWSGGIDMKSLMIPAIAFTVPYVLDYMAEGIERKDFQTMLINWAQKFAQINDRVKHFNEMLMIEIQGCIKADSYQNYCIHKTNLQKYIESIEKNVQKVSQFEQKDFQEMKERTQAYYKDYIQVEQDGWVAVYTPQQFQQQKKTKEN